MSLVINCKEHFEKVKTFAERVGMLEQFEEKLDYLSNYRGGECECHLGWDFAPQSFSFTMHRPDKEGVMVPWFNGGLIFHGDHDNGGDGSAPTFSVNLSPASGWQVHT